MKYHSSFSKLLCEFLEDKYESCTESYILKIGRALASFDVYCCKIKHKSGELTRELVDGWLSGHAHRSSDYQKQCRTAIRQFAIHLLENGMKAYVSPVYRPEVLPVDETFDSCLKDSIKGLVESKRARGYKYGPLNEYGILKRVDSFCVNEGLQKDELPRWIVEKWSEKINDEGSKSRANRIVVIRQLALFMISHGKKAYVAESIPFPHNPFPYIPDEKEMAALLVEIDLQKNKHPWSNYTLPVLFRLLLASGLRISEACSLKTNCVQFSCDDCCIIDVENSKGHKDRRIFLNGDTFILLRKYDEKMSFMIPSREWFFPSDYSPKEKHILASTARNHFNLARNNVFPKDSRHMPTVHCLRHAFIIWTLRRWRNEQRDIEKLLPYLSKHLGHSSIQETYTYYNHYNQDFEHIRKCTEYFERIIPEVRYDG